MYIYVLSYLDPDSGLFASLVRFFGSLLWFASLVRFFGSLLWFASLVRFSGAGAKSPSVANSLGQQ
ncbi:hypothetical protein AYI78_16940 [Shewanella algae]|nr:hypothetical protein AYI78_16940 [Shewanella algae]TVO92488.1 hypothetical protein AYI79_17260 [Shewanella algae]